MIRLISNHENAKIQKHETIQCVRRLESDETGRLEG